MTANLSVTGGFERTRHIDGGRLRKVRRSTPKESVRPILGRCSGKILSWAPGVQQVLQSSVISMRLGSVASDSISLPAPCGGLILPHLTRNGQVPKLDVAAPEFGRCARALQTSRLACQRRACCADGASSCSSKAASGAKDPIYGRARSRSPRGRRSRPTSAGSRNGPARAGSTSLRRDTAR